MSNVGAGTAIDTTIAEGTLDIEAGGVVSGGIIFDGAGSLEIGGTVMPTTAISGFSSDDGIYLSDIPFVSGASVNFDDATGIMTLTEAGADYALHLAGNYTGAIFQVVPPGFGSTATIITVSNLPCFVVGTRIATEDGPVAVEDLVIGTRALTMEGIAERIVWIGWRTIACERHPEPSKILPVRIRANAFDVHLPSRDLLLSPDHAVFVHGVLIPIKHLINGSSILQEKVSTVTYYHVELARHDVILAEGLPCESYLETGRRTAFANGGGAVMLHPEFEPHPDSQLLWDSLSYAPLVVTGPLIHWLREKLACRAAALAEISKRAA
jgi:hypothetical protein